MTERLLQFIWQFQYFNTNALTTTAGETIQVISAGLFNRNQGPDFSEAKIRIADTTWMGAVELHINKSDWKKHNHQQDKNYRNVILHVVWNDDELTDTTMLPVLELKSRVPKILLQRYEDLMHSPAFIPCENSIRRVKDIIWLSWKERLLAERLLRKSAIVEACLQENNQHWEETFWWLLARNFGIKVNADTFEAMARSVPIKLLAKFRNDRYRLEALLLGQAGLLDKDFTDDYPKLLQREYTFQQKTYQLQKIHKAPAFLRMRPGSFPTIRLAQLAALLHDSIHLFSKIKEETSVMSVKKMFNVVLADYWDTHYCFDELSVMRKKKLGQSMTDNILINTLSPVLFAYGQYHDEQSYKEKALRWLEETAAENNSIIAGFTQAGIVSDTAYDTQALLELKNEYCDKKRCLDCAAGSFLLKNQGFNKKF